MHVVRYAIAILLACLTLAAPSPAQQPNLEPNQPGNKPVPTVTFDLAFPGSQPAHFAVSVESTDKAAYRSDELAPDGKSTAGDPYVVRFVMSEATRTRIFELARQASHFNGNFDYTKNRVASTGTKTLTYSEGPAEAVGNPTVGTRNSTTYNYSENPAIQELTNIFLSISNTMELGARLDHSRRFDKLGLDAELKRAEEMAAGKQLLEMQAISPVLRAIANDSAALNLARQRARRLMALAGSREGQ